MTCDDVERLTDAYADGELDLERAMAVEAHMAECAACTARVDRLRSLSRTIEAAPYFRAPGALAERIRASMPVEPRPQAEPARSNRARWVPWLALAASLVIVSVGVIGISRERTAIIDSATIDAVIDGHVRSLMAGHLMDVASTDRHTVKPWFEGRIDFAPTVVDLASDGYPLVGGRLDYISQHAAAALVYKRREHPINVFLWPQATGSASHVTRSDARGYHVIYWIRGGTAVWVVSDVALDELTDFARRLDAAM